MNKLQIIISLLLLVLLCAGCSTFYPEPTSTAVPTAAETLVLSPTITNTPPPSLTPTPKPTHTPAVDPIEALMPVGEPAAEWQGIPIMPEAIVGEGDNTSYRFAIAATKFEIQAFYDKEMGRLGWESFATGSNDAGEIMMLMYSKDGEITTISLLKGPDSLVIVIFV